jgi:hypothetical protein
MRAIDENTDAVDAGEHGRPRDRVAPIEMVLYGGGARARPAELGGDARTAVAHRIGILVGRE